MTRDKIEGMQTQSQNGENPLQTQYAELMAPPDRKFESLNSTGSGTNNLPDLTIPGSGIDISKQADTPFRFIEAQFPENRGKIPEKSQYTLAKEEAAQRISGLIGEIQADTMSFTASKKPAKLKSQASMW